MNVWKFRKAQKRAKYVGHALHVGRFMSNEFCRDTLGEAISHEIICVLGRKMISMVED